ncbi:MAG TPA: sulfite exporter TauE/SafE family protein [Longimicrobiales bacterium]|nr:sulfite exporter TauE/SafE family protein [Longimicrobiales bacterium]
MTAAAVVALAGAGFLVGLLAGLVGIGGGVLIVPFLYFFYAHPVWGGVTFDPALHATVAHATSLFIIIPTAIVGTITYSRAGLVSWRAVLPIAAFSLISAVGGARLATLVPPEMLKLFFGCFLLFTAAQLAAGARRAPVSGPERHSLPVSALTGLAVGVFSAMLGVGGGLVAIPLLLYVMRMDLTRVAATSLAIVVFAATSGTITYMLTGAELPGLPPGHVGYVHVAAAIPMIPGAMIAARWGSKLNQRLDATKLRWIFAILFLIMGLRIAVANLFSLAT